MIVTMEEPIAKEPIVEEPIDDEPEQGIIISEQETVYQEQDFDNHEAVEVAPDSPNHIISVLKARLNRVTMTANSLAVGNIFMAMDLEDNENRTRGFFASV